MNYRYFYYLFVFIIIFQIPFLSGSDFERQKEIFDLGIQNLENHPQKIKDFTFNCLEQSDKWHAINKRYVELLQSKKEAQQSESTWKGWQWQSLNLAMSGDIYQKYFEGIVALNYIENNCKDINTKIFLTGKYCSRLLTTYLFYENPEKKWEEKIKSNEFIKEITDYIFEKNDSGKWDCYFTNVFFKFREFTGIEEEFKFIPSEHVKTEDQEVSRCKEDLELFFKTQKRYFTPFIFMGKDSVINEKVFVYALSKGFALYGLTNTGELVHGGKYQLPDDVYHHDKEHEEFLIDKTKYKENEYETEIPQTQKYLTLYGQWVYEGLEKKFKIQESKLAGYAAFFATHEQFISNFIQKFMKENLLLQTFSTESIETNLSAPHKSNHPGLSVKKMPTKNAPPLKPNTTGINYPLKLNKVINIKTVPLKSKQPGFVVTKMPTENVTTLDKPPYFKDFSIVIMKENKLQQDTYAKDYAIHEVKSPHYGRIISYYDMAKSIVNLIPSLKNQVFYQETISDIYVPYNHKLVFELHEKLLEWFFARILNEHEKDFSS